MPFLKHVQDAGLNVPLSFRSEVRRVWSARRSRFSVEAPFHRQTVSQPMCRSRKAKRQRIYWCVVVCPDLFPVRAISRLRDFFTRKSELLVDELLSVTISRRVSTPLSFRLRTTPGCCESLGEKLHGRAKNAADSGRKVRRKPGKAAVRPLLKQK